jgi:hypothetical protein
MVINREAIAQDREVFLMKKSNKHKTVSLQKSLRQQSISVSVSGTVRRARTFPIAGCWITSGWDQEDNSGLVEVVVAREQPDGAICFGTYLVDKYCLGLKNTFTRAGYSRRRFEDELHGKMFPESSPVACSPELAHQMVYASIDYAARFGFTPQEDFALSQYVLTPRGELEEPYDLVFGKDGKPFFIAGPYDDANLILRQLRMTAGEGNYHYLVALGDPRF